MKSDKAPSAGAPEVTLADALHLMGLHEGTTVVRGAIFYGQTNDDELCVADSGSSYVVVSKRDVVAVTQLGQGISEVRILASASLWRTAKGPAVALTETKQLARAFGRADEQSIPPAISFRAADDPTEGGTADQAKLTSGATIEGAAKVFKRECAGGGEYANNCAHFLCNAFMKAGFTDFDTSHSCVNARCNTKEGQIKPCTFTSPFKYRVIRAKELRCWFDEKSTTSADQVTKGSGFWAAYQERPSDGQGHVAILDSNNWLFYGTGWFSKAQGWKQEYYKW